MAYPSTFKDLQDGVITKLRLDASLDRAAVKDWINQAYFEAVAETEFYTSSSAAATLTANQGQVNVPTSLVKIDYIVPTGSDGANWGPMEGVTFEEILQNRAWSSGASSSTGAPTLYAFRNAASPTIEVWPNASGGETLTFYGISLPAAMSADGDLSILPEPYATNILDYGACVMAAEFKKDPLMGYYSQLSDQWIRLFRGFLNTRVGNSTQQFRVERQRPYPRSPSTDSAYTY